MTSLFQRLDEEEAIVRGELTALREKIAVTEERLARLTITRETAASLLGNHGSAEASGEGPVGPDQAAASDNSARESPTSFTSTGATSSDAPVPPPSPLSWEVAREKMLVLLAGAGRAMKVQDICVAIGEDVTNHRRVETTRSRLKRMAKDGRVTEGPTAYFRIVATGSGQQPGAGMG
ncbi:hypothetical protein [Streptomyces sp. NBC_01727]|uniref:hypothetical protein n=1 Tax=Streptomyces sp. NBC_01727 TaxID=2975924 RepID=UPI002E142BA9|nr:hypothetical protein OIE76_40835 [Streptomyces sp. NBC_01727]